MPAFLNPANAEFWVGVGLLIFLGIVIFVAKAPKAINAALDAKSAKIQCALFLPRIPMRLPAGQSCALSQLAMRRT